MRQAKVDLGPRDITKCLEIAEYNIITNSDFCSANKEVPLEAIPKKIDDGYTLSVVKANCPMPNCQYLRMDIDEIRIEGRYCANPSVISANPILPPLSSQYGETQPAQQAITHPLISNAKPQRALLPTPVEVAASIYKGLQRIIYRRA
jgi:hypothetical protein